MIAGIVAGGRVPAPPPVAGNDYRRYRFDIASNNGDGQYTGMDELYASDTIGGSDHLNLGAASAPLANWTASSSYTGEYPPSRPFNHDQSFSPTGWVNNGGATGWIKHNAGAPRTVTHIGLRTMLSETGRMPARFRLNYSDDNWATKTTALDVAGIAAWTQDLIRMWEVPDVGAHQYWEYEIVANKGDGYCSLGECFLIYNNGEMARTGARNAGVRRSSDLGGGSQYDATNIIRRDANYWVGNLPPQWLEVICAKPIVQFKISCKEPARMPKNFTVSGYDLTTQAWVQLKTFGPQTGWAVGETRTFTI